MAYLFGSTVLHDTVNYDLYQKSFDFVTAAQARFKIAHIRGMKKVGVTQNERQIKVVVRVNGASRADLEAKVDTLYQGLNLPSQRLSLHLLDSRYFVADCIGAVMELAPIKGGGFPGSGVNWADVTIQFVCANPYALSVTSVTIDSGVVNMIASTVGTYSYYQEVVGTAGTVFTRPQVRITQSGTSLAWTSLTVQQLVNNQQLILTSGLPVTSGDYLDIFCDPMASSGQSVQRNSSGVPLPFSGLFPVLEPIPTAWRFIVAAPSRPSIRVQWTYTPRWLT